MIHKYKAWNIIDKVFYTNTTDYLLGGDGKIYEPFIDCDCDSNESCPGKIVTEECRYLIPLFFTGLTDIHNEELYYKDFVEARDIRHKSANLIRGWIDYDNGSFCINDGICNHYRWIDYGVEKIGNILENPELLEGL